jgi:hypothetical protein
LQAEENEWVTQLNPLPLEEWASRFPLNKRKQLIEANHKVYDFGVNKGIARVSCFIKNETSTTATDPRNISPRTPEFLSVVGPYVSALEKAAKAAPYLVKGRNIEDRDALLHRLDSFPFLMETDQERLDRNMDQPIIRDFEMEFWDHVFPSAEHFVFHEVMQLALTTTGLTPFALMYYVEGTRVSGDSHTSIMNGLFCRFMQWLCNYNLPPESWDSSHEGDDALTAGLLEYKNALIFLTNMMWLLGFGVKLQLPPSLAESTFCGRRHVPIPGGLRSMCDIRRTLAKFHITQSGLPGRRAIIAKAYSYWSTDSQTPIVGPLCYALLTVLAPTAHDYTHILRSQRISSWEKDKIVEGASRALKKPEVLVEQRAVMDNHDNISIALQLSVESAFEKWLRQGFVPMQFPTILDADIHVDDHRSTYFGPDYPMFLVPTTK